MHVNGSQTVSRSPPRTNDFSPAVRRAPISQARSSTAKPTMYQAAFHLVATARPRNTPAASCHLRRPRRGATGTAWMAHDEFGQPGPGDVPVDQDAAERGQHEEHREDVQD